MSVSLKTEFYINLIVTLQQKTETLVTKLLKNELNASYVSVLLIFLYSVNMPHGISFRGYTIRLFMTT